MIRTVNQAINAGIPLLQEKFVLHGTMVEPKNKVNRNKFNILSISLYIM